MSSCLGLEDESSKTYDSVHMDWILKAPEQMRISFLHGLCDGDGCASLDAQFLTIGTSSNARFFRRLLSSLGIESHQGSGAIVVSSHMSILRAAEIGLFRYSSERKKNLEKLADMISTFDNTQKMTVDHFSLVRRLREHGESWGRISWMLYDEFEYTWPYYTIMRWTKSHYGEQL